MGIYRDQVLPRIIDRACGSDDVAGWRRRCVEGLHGVVVEPGFGSGLNVEHYPDGVDVVHAVDPAEVGRRLAAERIRDRGIEVRFAGRDGQALPLETDSCDAGLVTFTLCTIPDPTTALAELRRVIRPGGTLHFLEHGHAPGADVQKWQRRLEPVQRRLFDGCHLTRDTTAMIDGAGFDIVWSDAAFAGGPRPLTYFTVGKAVCP